MKKRKKIKNIDLWKMNKVQLIQKINTLDLEIETLKDSIKDELFKKFMEKLGEPETAKRLKKENADLRNRIKEFKNKIVLPAGGNKK